MSRSLPQTPAADRTRILVICDFFLPGRKAGGGVWTIINLIERLCDSYEFFVITRNHDGRSDREPYPNVNHKEWNEIGRANVFYLPPQNITSRRLAELTNIISPDAVYLNSVFSDLVVRFIIARRLGMIRSIPTIVAPIGNLAPGALKFKGLKKGLYLYASKRTSLYRNVIWKASSPLEKDEVRAVFGKRARTTIAPDLSPRQILPEFCFESKPVKKPGAARLAFYSRVDPKKNLIFLLDRLASIDNGEIELTVAGPVDDEQYWSVCKKKIAELPKNIRVEMLGVTSYEAGLKLLIDSHFFVLPTLGENFGYVFLEALAAGCPLLISEHTMWGEVDIREAGWTIPLDSKVDWESKIRRCIEMDPENYAAISKRARGMAVDWINNAEIENATRELFRSILTAS